jgi:hypothetical protein
MGAMSIEKLSLGLATDSQFELDLTVYDQAALGPDGTATTAVEEAAGAFERETRTASAGYLDVSLDGNPEAISNATFDFSLSKAYLDDLGVDASDVTLYRNVDTGWQELSTTPSRENDTHQFFSSESPGFSVFAVGTGVSILDVSDASLDADSIRRGESASVSLSVANDGVVADSHELSVALDGTNVATETVDVSPGSSTATTLQFEPSGTGEFTVTVAGVDAGTLTVRSDETDESGAERQDGDGGTATDNDGGVPLVVLIGGVVILLLVALMGFYTFKQNTNRF